MPRGKSFAFKIGGKIKRLRLERQLSQFDLAEKAGIGISYISKIEQGNRFPSLKTTIKIAKALNVELCEVFNFKGLALDRERPSKDYLELIGLLKDLPDDEIKLLLELSRKLSSQ